jgi:type IV pilus assembly protein PilA
MKKNSGFTLIELMIVVAIIAIIAAIAIPAILRARISGNETSAVGTLRTLITQENMWHKQDVDANSVSDYWTVDVCGMYRTVRQTTGTEAMLVDLAVARSDWSPDGSGAGATGVSGTGGTATGSFPIVAAVFGAAQVPGLAAMAHTSPVPKSGYYVAAFANDAANTAYSQDMDGAGNFYENTSRFAFMAFPDTYDGTGMNAFITDASGVIWRIDAATGLYNLPAGPVNATFPPYGTHTITAWPNANPTAAGYTQTD